MNVLPYSYKKIERRERRMTTVLGSTKEGKLMHKIGNGYYRYSKLNKEELSTLNLLVQAGNASVLKKGKGYAALIKLTERGRMICNEH